MSLFGGLLSEEPGFNVLIFGGVSSRERFKVSLFGMLSIKPGCVCSDSGACIVALPFPTLSASGAAGLNAELFGASFGAFSGGMLSEEPGFDV